MANDSRSTIYALIRTGRQPEKFLAVLCVQGRFLALHLCRAASDGVGADVAVRFLRGYHRPIWLTNMSVWWPIKRWA